MPDLTLELHPHILSDMLICPVCGSNLHISENHQSLVCGGIKQHCFDGGGGGYLPLAPRHSGGGVLKVCSKPRNFMVSKVTEGWKRKPPL